jgi:C4-dicarboxylate transporter, DctQ subunit
MREINMLKRANLIFDFLIDSFASLSAFLLAFIMIAVCIDIILRYSLQRPTQWVSEVTEYCLLWIGFLAAAWVLKKDGHVSLDLVTSRLNQEAQAFLAIVNSIIGAAVYLFLTWYGTIVTLDLFHRGLHMSTIIGPPAYILYLIIPLGSILFSIQFMKRTYNSFIKWKDLRSKKSISFATDEVER